MSQPPILHSKNIVYNSHITAGGNIHVGDNYYTVEKDFEESILFLKIDAVEGAADHYEAQLFIKSPHKEHLAGAGEALLKEKIQLSIPSQLWTQVQNFQTNRRGGSEIYRKFQFSSHGTPQAQENHLIQLLMTTFFSGDIGKICGDFIHLLQHQKINELLLVIASEAEEVRNLPWEMLVESLFPSSYTDKGSEKKNLAKSNFGILRTVSASIQDFNLKADHTQSAPLKLLFVASLPENLSDGSKMLQIEDEQKKLIEAVGGLEVGKKPKMVIEFLDNASLQEIDEALTERNHDIVHISGHGAYNTNVKQGVLYLEDEDGDVLEITGSQLGEQLQHHACVKLLVLSACETAIAGTEGTAEQLTKTGIPAIVGMRFPVTDEGAKQFTTQFYKALANGRSLTHALAEGRRTLWKSIQDHRKIPNARPRIAEWFTPVVYQNQYIGALVDTQKTYNANLLHRFYPKVQIEKTKQSRFIGQGFIGRKRPLIRLRKSLRQNRPVCIHGLGGFGKTTLVEAFAHQYRKRYGCEILMWRGNEGQINEQVVLEDLLMKYELTQPDAFAFKKIEKFVKESDADPRAKLQKLLDNYLQRHPTILVFDNFEDVQVAAENGKEYLIADEGLKSFLLHLLQNAPPKCHLLFTTRYPISDLLPQVLHLPLHQMSYAEQYRFLQYSEVLRAIPMEDRDQLYKRLEGHPRALEYLEALTKNDVDWKELDKQVGKVSADIYANLYLEKIYQKLPEDAQKLFAQLSVLIGRTPLAALVEMTQQDESALIPLLQILRNWSVCFWDEKAKIVGIHALTQDWLQKNALPPTHPSFKNASNTLGEYFRNQPTWADEILAKEYFEAAENWEDFANTSFNLQNHYQLIGTYEKAYNLNWRLLEKEIGERNKGVSYNNLGLIFKIKGKLDRALYFYHQGLEIAKKLNNRKGESVILNNISLIYSAKGDYDTALKCLEQSLQIRQQIGDRKGEGTTLNNLATIAYAKGDYDTALTYLEQSLQINQQIGDRQGEGTTLNNISQIYAAKGDYDTALKCLEQSLQIRQQIGDRQGEGYTLNNISLIYFAKGDYDTALKCLEQSLQIMQQIGDRKGEGYTLNNISQIYAAKGDYDTALKCLEQSLQIMQQIGDRKGEGYTLNNISQIYAAKGDYDTALKCLEQSLQIRQQIGDINGMANTFFNMGALYFKLKQFEQAVLPLIQAYQIFQQIGSPNAQAVEGWLNSLIGEIGEERFEEISSKKRLPMKRQKISFWQKISRFFTRKK